MADATVQTEVQIDEHTPAHEAVVPVTEEDVKISGGTIARTVVFAIVWLNMLLAFLGAPTLDIDTDALYQLISGIAAFIVSIVAWWKNNSFTVAAIVGDSVMNEVRDQLKDA